MNKSILLPVMGMSTLIFFIGISWINNHVFLDKLLLCGFILTVIFIARLREIK
jgi:arginine exporter protein ArgO